MIRKFHLRHVTPTILLIGAILPVGMALRMLFLARQSLGLSETTSVAFARFSWSGFPHSDPNMSLYYALLHPWLGFGETEFLIRALSVLLSVASIAVFYALGAGLFGARVGLIGALLLTVNAFHVRYAQEARSYSLLVLLTTLSTYFYWKSIERPVTRNWIMYGAASVLAVYSHFFGALVLLAQWISLGFLPFRTIPWKRLLATVSAIGALLLPLAIAAMSMGDAQIGWIPKTQASSVPILFSSLSGAGGFGDSPGSGDILSLASAGRRLLLFAYVALSTVAAVVAVREGFATRASMRSWRYGILFAWLLTPVVVTLGVSLVRPLFIDRYFIVSLPPFVLLAAIGLSRFRPRPAFVLAMVLVLILAVNGVVTYFRYFGKEDWRGATRHILIMGRATDLLVIYPHGRQAFEYYQRRAAASHDTPRVLTSDWGALRDPDDRVWLVFRNADIGKEQNAPTFRLIQTRVKSGRQLNDKWLFRGVSVELYERVAAR